MRDKHKTKVVFRWYRKYGECIALFPQNPADLYGFMCNSYMHVGQHGGADPQIVVRQTRPATKKEYTPLAKELRQQGYRLDIRKRCTSTDRRIRMAEARNK